MSIIYPILLFLFALLLIAGISLYYIGKSVKHKTAKKALQILGGIIALLPIVIILFSLFKGLQNHIQYSGIYHGITSEGYNLELELIDDNTYIFKSENCKTTIEGQWDYISNDESYIELYSYESVCVVRISLEDMMIFNWGKEDFICSNGEKVKLRQEKSLRIKELRQESVVLNEFKNEYNKIISFSKKCKIPYKKTHYILCWDEEKLDSFRWTINYEKDENGYEKIANSKIEKLEINKDSIQTVLHLFETQGFWQLNQDSLNYQPSAEAIFVLNGCDNEFEFFYENSYWVTSSYSPDVVQQNSYVQQRDKFIKCRNEFEKLFHE